MKRASRLLALAGLLVTTAGFAATAKSSRPLLHKPAPAFVRIDLDGNEIGLRAMRGKVVLLNFWATWCGPCLEELPRFKEWQRRYGDQGFAIIAVSMDDSPDPVRVFVGRLRPNFSIVMGDEKLGNLYGGILGLPVSYLIGREGRVEARLSGATDLDAFEARIEELLKKPAR